MIFEVDSEALREAREAAAWYALRREGLGEQFAEALSETFHDIKNSPRRFAQLFGISDQVRVRRSLVDKFPYLVVYFETEERIRIVAVMHAKRRPECWKDRLP